MDDNDKFVWTEEETFATNMAESNMSVVVSFHEHIFFRLVLPEDKRVLKMVGSYAALLVHKSCVRRAVVSTK